MDVPARTRPRYDLEEAYRRHFGGVWGVLMRLGVERADLEDAVHDVFLVAHRRRDAFTGESSMRTWLLGICRRVAADHRRRHRRHRRRVDGLRPVVPRATEPDDTLLHRDGLRLLQDFLTSLDDSKREIFVMVELEQLTGSEAARVLGLNRNTAAARLRAARRAFAGYTRQLRCPPPQLLVAARRSPRPDPVVERRVLGVLLVRLGEGGAPATPPSFGAGSGLVSVKAAMVSVAIAATTLGALKAGGALWPRPAPRASVDEPPGRSPARVLRGAVAAVAEAPRPGPPAASGVEHPPSAPRGPTAAAPSPASAPSAGATMTRAPASVPASVPASTHTPAATKVTGEPGARTAPRSTDPVRDPLRDPLRIHSQALERAREALRGGDARGALALVDAAISAHPTGALTRELALVRVEALCAQGQRSRARDAAEALRRAHAGSPAAERARCP